MKTKFYLLAVLLGTMSLNAAHEFVSPVYKAIYYAPWSKDSGLMHVTHDKKTLFVGNVVAVALKDENGKVTPMREKRSAVFEWKNNVLTSTRPLVETAKEKDNVAGPPAATVLKTQTFNPESISVKAVIRNNTKLTLANSGNVFRDVLFMPVKDIVGMRVEGTLPDGQTRSALIPVKYDAKKWGFRGRFTKLQLIGETSVITVTAANGCLISFGYYGWSPIEMSVHAAVASGNPIQEAGTENVIEYTIFFEKAE